MVGTKILSYNIKRITMNVWRSHLVSQIGRGIISSKMKTFFLKQIEIILSCIDNKWCELIFISRWDRNYKQFKLSVQLLAFCDISGTINWISTKEKQENWLQICIQLVIFTKYLSNPLVLLKVGVAWIEYATEIWQNTPRWTRISWTSNRSLSSSSHGQLMVWETS